jgi:DNA-binding HxlR family transcriptional regulator
MYQKKTETEIRCPLEYGIGILSGKWKSRIICMLGTSKSLHYRELKENLINVKDGVLSANLNELIRMDIVSKKNDNTGNNFTEYRLTEKGMLLIPLLQGLCRWGGSYYKEQSNVVMKHCVNCDYYREWKAAVNEENI